MRDEQHERHVDHAKYCMRAGQASAKYSVQASQAGCKYRMSADQRERQVLVHAETARAARGGEPLRRRCNAGHVERHKLE